MGSELGLWRRMVLSVQTRLFAHLVRRIDHFVLVTEAMADRLGVDRSRYVVVEGMIEAGGGNNEVARRRRLE